MKELKIKIWNIENIVIMRVLDQDESLRGKGFIYEAKNGITIASDNSPCIYETAIFINGDDKDFDNKLDGLSFKITQEAKEYIEKVKEAVAEYNSSIKEEILDKKEKEYLSAVIKPFRNEVEYIEKNSFARKIDKYSEYIGIRTKRDFFHLPNFIPDTMYKGMELERKYTLEELGL